MINYISKNNTTVTLSRLLKVSKLKFLFPLISYSAQCSFSVIFGSVTDAEADRTDRRHSYGQAYSCL